ncbi:hypothetical protein U7230_08115 [Carboxydochorda subterranea]|uniref:Uncharacterized protein n=1 Tax=Carboxydichorda subterranea TaxID=3109565 RepID=A0ABZ1BTG9_9FIRM|nr:hypothetical protein [Limnochorda sp. L945t]WRP16074.1 hypothetical protein U7230_08115 [Limnochorda sp. L945t]
MDYLTAKNRAPWIFGLEPGELRPFVETYHLGVIEDVGNREYQTRYLSPRGRSLLVTDAERVVHLVRA